VIAVFVLVVGILSIIAFFVIGAHFPVAEHPFLQVKNYILGGLLSVLLLNIAILVLLMKYLTNPLLLFVRHVEELPQKRGDERFCRIGTGGEIGALVKSFNRMVEELDNQKQALLESEELHRTLIDFTSEFIFWRSADGSEMLYVSPQCLQYTGYTDAEFYLRPGLLDEIMHPADRDMC